MPSYLFLCFILTIIKYNYNRIDSRVIINVYLYLIINFDMAYSIVNLTNIFRA